jgi:alkylation response protein AidB-like acyl-CoA dehydrogenase
MSSPSNFGFGEEEQALRDAARKFLTEHLPTDRLHRLVAARDASGPAWEPALWRQMGELGWTGVGVPERCGGVGMPTVAAVALAEEAGRAALPSPLIGTLQASAVLAACASSAADALLTEIAQGEAVALAITGQRGAWRGDACDAEYRDGALYGMAYWVQDAAKAGVFLVKARGPAGAGLYAVRAGAAGLSVLPDAIVDLTRDQGRLSLEAVPAIEIAPPGAAAAAIAAAEPALFTLVAADLCGAAEWLLQTTAEYARVRQQFDRQIGFFQAVKHPLVDAMIAIDGARSHVYNAAAAIDHDPAAALRAAHMAKAAASDAATFGASRAVQFHGGIGFTWECYVQVYFKRQLHNASLFGDAAWHRACLAEVLFAAA